MSNSAEQLEQAKRLKADGNYDDAIGILAAILEHEPDNADAHRQLGLVYGFQGLFDESLEELGRAVVLSDGRADVLCDLAMTHCMLGMYEEAKPEFERVLELDPENKTAKQQMVYFSGMTAAT